MTSNKILRNLRLSKNISIKELSDVLSIKSDFIVILESGDFDSFISKKDMEVILKKYSCFFELDFKKFKEYFVSAKANRYYKNVFLKKTNQNFSFFGFVKTFSLVTIILVLFFYIGIEVKNRYSKPDLFVVGPVDNYSTKNKEISINGKTAKNSIVKINGEFILVDNDGNFSKSILLNNGLNVIRISAAKDGGVENVVTKRVVLEDGKLTMK